MPLQHGGSGGNGNASSNSAHHNSALGLNNIADAIEGELNSISQFLNKGRLPHYDNSPASVHNFEPVYLNQFDVIITPPAHIGNHHFTDLLIEQVKSVTGLPEIVATDTVDQSYMWGKRTFSKPVPAETTAELEIKFEVNLNARNTMYVYEMLRMWSDLSFDYGTGFHGMKRQYAGKMTVLIHNKRYRVFRQFHFNSVYLMAPLTQMDLDYLSDEIYVLTAKFKSDGWKEKRTTLGKLL